MFPNNVRLGGRRTTLRQPLAALRGPAEAVSRRRTTTQTDDPGAFCAALLSVRTYALPPAVDTPTWRVALRHFARTNPTDLEFRRLLERRAALPADRDAGGRVAAVLLREWERYSVARLLSRRTTVGNRRRGSPPARPRAAVMPGQPGSGGGVPQLAQLAPRRAPTADLSGRR
jgi:hypothetical protein